MTRPRRIRFAWLPIAAALAAGCVAPSTEVERRRASGACGVRAAMDTRLPERFRDTPPACDLPSAAEVAGACAIKDLIDSPDYRPPTYDEEGMPSGGSPAPAYVATDLRCRFTSPDRNAAACRFRLTLPGAGGSSDAEAVLEHRFVQDHGPAHHVYGTMWMAERACRRSAPRPPAAGA